MKTLDYTKPYCENIPPINGGKYTQDGILYDRHGVALPPVEVMPSTQPEAPVETTSSAEPDNPPPKVPTWAYKGKKAL